MAIAFSESRRASPEERLHYAAARGEIKTIKEAIKDGANLEARDFAHRTPLMCATQNSQRKAAIHLLEAGASVGSEDSHGRTPLHYAAHFGEEDILRELISRGANPKALDKHGNSPADAARALGHGAIADRLIEAFAAQEAQIIQEEAARAEKMSGKAAQPKARSSGRSL